MTNNLTKCTAIAASALWMLGCGGEANKPAVPNATTRLEAKPHAGSWEKGGSAFRAAWTWSSSSAGVAHVNLTITPTSSGKSLKIVTRLPQGVSLLSGELGLTTVPTANTPVGLSFEVAFSQSPMIPVEVLLIVEEGHQSAGTIPVRDPDAVSAAPSEKAGSRTDVGGFPGRVGGELEPGKPDKK